MNSRVLLLTLLLGPVFSAPAVAEAMKPPSPTSPLAKVRTLWKKAVAQDISKHAEKLNELDAAQRKLLPASATDSAAAAVTAGWKLQPEAQKLLDSLIGKIHAYNKLVHEFRPKETQNPEVLEAGVVDLLFISGVPLDGRRWESLRPLLLPVKAPEAAESDDPWIKRDRPRRWTDLDGKGLELGDLGWSTPDSDGADWKTRDARWSYDFAILHLWLARPPEAVAKRLRGDWIKTEAGVAETDAWAKQPEAGTIRLFAGDYLWHTRPRPAASPATRFQAVNRQINPDAVKNADEILQALRVKHALLHCLAETVIAGGVAPVARSWLDSAAHANPPWTRFEPELGKDGHVRALRAASSQPSPTASSFQLPHQIAAFQPDLTWRPAVQSWSGWLPLPAKKSADDTKPAPAPGPEPIRVPLRPLDKAWTELCKLAAAEVFKVSPDSSLRALPPRTPGWWIAFDVKDWSAALTEAKLQIAADGAPVQIIFSEIGEMAEAQAFLNGKPAGQSIRVPLPGPWPATFATPTRPWSVGLPLVIGTLITLVFLVGRLRAKEHRGETVGQFFLHWPRNATTGLAFLCFATALALWWMGPVIQRLKTPVSGVVEFQLSAHEAVPEAQRQVQALTCTKAFNKLAGEDAVGVETWLARWWRNLMVGIFVQGEPRPALAAADTTWRLVAVAQNSGWTRHGLLRAENKPDFTAALAEMPFAGQMPALPPALLSAPSAGSTLTITDGDDGDLQTHTISGESKPASPVLTLHLATPPADPRSEVQSDVPSRHARLAALSTRVIAPFESLSKDQPAAPAQPEDLDARRREFWEAVGTATRESWAEDGAEAFLAQSRNDETKEGPARLFSRLEGWVRWAVIILAALAGGLVLAVVLGRVLTWLRQMAGKKFSLACACAAGLAWFSGFVFAAAVLAAVEPWAIGYGGALPGAARVLSIGMAAVLIFSFWPAVRLHSHARVAWGQGGRGSLRLLAIGVGLLLAILALAGFLFLPVTTLGTEAAWPGGYSMALLVSALLTSTSLALVTWAASASARIVRHNRR